MGFRVGDKVKFLTNKLSRSSVRIGEIQTVTEVDSRYILTTTDDPEIEEWIFFKDYHHLIVTVDTTTEYPKEALKNDEDYKEKPPMEYIPTEAILEVARVFGFGAQKYAPDNWRDGFKHRRLASAALRHIMQYLDGEDKDSESNLEHLAHACCGLLMLLEHKFKGYGEDNRHEKD